MDSNESKPYRAPLSTYRIQFNRHFTFREAAELVPYLSRLGVSDLYASPYLEARPGSLHGYDIINHNRLNPEIGTPEEHTRLTSEIRRHGMGHLLDIVPNHMGVGQADNEWWLDVLENGPSSVFAPYFDIDWEPLKPELAGKVLLPLLGDQFGQVLENGELQLRYDGGSFRVEYHEHHFPVAPKSSSLVLRRALDRLAEHRAEGSPDRIELESIVTALEHLPPRSRTDARSVAERRRENAVTRRRLSALHESSAEFRQALERTLEEFNGRQGDPHSFDLLARLLDDQAYRLAFWRVAAEEINYRRFFDINDLAGVRVERPEVFQATHRLILQLVEEGKVTGLRIDHPDGLYDPQGYLQDLQAESERRTGGPLFVVVEKILTGEEHLPDRWPVAGTVGYEFMNRLNGLFVAPEQEAAMSAVYTGFLGDALNFRELVYDRKKLIMRVALASELNVLAYLLNRLSEQNRRFRDFTLGSLRDALRETVACFPVYRTYIDAHVGRVADGDRAQVERAIREAIRRNPSTSRSIYHFLRRVLLLEWPDDLGEEERREHARFVMKFQQFTGPVMAKGVEDTAFYVYNRLISLNEVGGEPGRYGVPPREFHEWMQRRHEHWPHAMNSMSTHDTKRSQDVRARINVLSEMPEEWGERVRRWAGLNERHKRVEDGQAMPDCNDEYLMYQTLLGAWPLEPMDARGHASFVERIQRYMEKATREAKRHTSWINPNEDYDSALRDFVGAVLAWDPQRGAMTDQNPFLADFVPFQARLAQLGMLNALSQTLVHLAAPGVPDLYQGQEVWDFSLVDPDNRRPVDYALRERMLDELASRADDERGLEALAAELLDGWRDGRVKLFVTRTALHLRRTRPDLFLRGEYLPLRAEGPRAEHIVAFALRHQDDVAIVAVPRLWATLLGEDRSLPDPAVWDDTTLACAPALAGRYRNLLGGGEVVVEADGDGAGAIQASDILGRFPVALLQRV